MSTFLTLHSNKSLYAHGDIFAEKNLVLGDQQAPKFKLDLTADPSGHGSLVTELKSTFNAYTKVTDSFHVGHVDNVDVTPSFAAQAVGTIIRGGSGGAICLDVKNSGMEFGRQLSTLSTGTAGSLAVATLGAVADTLVKGTMLFDDATTRASPSLAVKGAIVSGDILTTGAHVESNLTVGNEAAPQISMNNNEFKMTRTTSIGSGNLLYAWRGGPGAERVTLVEATTENGGDVATFKGTGIDFKRDVEMPNNTINCNDIIVKKIECIDIVVNGTMTTKHTEQVNIGDNHMYLNAFGLPANSASDPSTPESSGIVSACRTRTSYADVTITPGATANDPVDVTFDAVPGWVNDADAPANRIIQLSARDGENNDSTVFGLYQLDGVSANNIQLLSSGGLTFCRNTFPTNGQVGISGGSMLARVAVVEVSHLYFYEGADDHHSGNHGTVKYGHGFSSSFEYVDLTNGDIQHSYKTVTGANADLAIVANVTNVTTTAFSSEKGLVLPDAPDGSEYKVINSVAGSTVIVKAGSIPGEDGAPATPMTMYGADPASNASAEVYGSMVFTKAGSVWHLV